MLSATLATAITQITQSVICHSAPVGGGDISQAARLTLDDGRLLLVKYRQPSINGMFTAEANGLALLRASQTLRIPQLWGYAEAVPPCPAFILMEWLGRGPSTPVIATELGRGLAAMHATPSPQPSPRPSPRGRGSFNVPPRPLGEGWGEGAFYGLDHDNFIGANPQPNHPCNNWVDFFREQRLGYQMELARQRGYLSAKRGQSLETLLANLGNWLPAQPPVSLLHGDLWGGNWLVTDMGEAALIDPAVYYGDREAELAFTELFGGFPSQFYAAYNEVWPLESGYGERKELYNLYHLLNHLNLFGESYGGSVDAILRKFS